MGFFFSLSSPAEAEHWRRSVETRCKGEEEKSSAPSTLRLWSLLPEQKSHQESVKDIGLPLLVGDHWWLCSKCWTMLKEKMVKELVRLSTLDEEVLRVNADKFNLRGHGERMDPGRKWVKSKIHNNGQLRIATPPRVAHASRLGQKKRETERW